MPPPPGAPRTHSVPGPLARFILYIYTVVVRAKKDENLENFG